MPAFVALIFHFATRDSSLLSDAGNWAAILAAAILVCGLVFGWFRQVSHALHIAEEKVSVGADDEGVYLVPGVYLLNTAPIPLRYEVVKFEAKLGDEEPVNVADADETDYIAPHQRMDWNGKRLRPDAWDLVGGIRIEARYEVQYGRKGRFFWWWRRAIRGGYAVDMPRVSGEPMSLLAEPLNGPSTDTRVPWTSKTFLGWRL